MVQMLGSGWISALHIFISMLFHQIFFVTAASLHMTDRASNWFQTYKHSQGAFSWEHFVVAVSREFEVNTHHIKIKELLMSRQTGSVEDYKL
jgi:hypothetical protein